MARTVAVPGEDWHRARQGGAHRRAYVDFYRDRRQGHRRKPRQRLPITRNRVAGSDEDDA